MQGRLKITTNVPEITYENVISVLQRAIGYHEVNAQKIQELIDIEEGVQPILRQKEYRADIDCHITDNIANEIVEFKLALNYGNPITFKKRDHVEGKSEAVQKWNDQYILADSDSANQKLARYFEIGGIGNIFIDLNSDWVEGDCYYRRTALSPLTSFVVYSSYYADEREMMGVTFRKDDDGVRHYTCYTKNNRFDVKNWTVMNGKELKEEWGHELRSGELNPLREIPIIEYQRSHDRMGCFEREISAILNVSLLISDFTNDVDQNTQAVWWTSDVEFEKQIIKNEDGSTTEVEVHPKSNEWVSTYTTRDGKTPKIQPLTIDYDYQGILNNIITQRSLILQRCNVPQRSDNSGGSTGVAMSDATGWSAAEIAAAKEEMIISKSLRKEIRVICAAIRESQCPEDDPLNELLPSDLVPSIKRQKSFELSVKTTAIATLLDKGFSLEDTLDAVDLFADPAQVIERSGEGVKAKQNVEEEEEVTPQSDDPIYQIENSPTIDGMSKETPKEDE